MVEVDCPPPGPHLKVTLESPVAEVVASEYTLGLELISPGILFDAGSTITQLYEIPGAIVGVSPVL
jgi:hypothetical protein